MTTPGGSKVFFDTNVVLYALTETAAKSDKALELLQSGGTISVQVLNEFAAIARRKLRLPWSEIRDLLGQVEVFCREVEALTPGAHHLALRIAERYKLSIYDANIAACALLADCRILYSEDMQDGQRIEGLTIRNPFSGLAPGLLL